MRCTTTYFSWSACVFVCEAQSGGYTSEAIKGVGWEERAHSNCATSLEMKHSEHCSADPTWFLAALLDC
jgi:hypothetical protein